VDDMSPAIASQHYAPNSPAHDGCRTRRPGSANCLNTHSVSLKRHAPRVGWLLCPREQTMKQLYSCIAVATAAAALCACNDNNNGEVTPSGSVTSIPSSVQLTSGNYSLSIFAQPQGVLRPDDIIQVGSTVFIIYQDNNNLPDGTLAAGVTAAQSEVIEFDLNGNILHTFNVPGHPDGLVEINSTTVWVSCNEDANPVIAVLDITNNTVQLYASDVATLPHGGGFDDMKLISGRVYASASNPTVTTTPAPNLAPYSTDGNGSTAQFGVNTGPVLYTLALNGDGTTFHATPVLSSSTPATLLPGNTPVTLNMTDPDSSAIDPSGDLVIDSQQDSELVFVKNVGTATQSVDVLPLTLYGNPWPVDDTRWSPASGNSFMLLSDNTQLVVYRVDALGGFPAQQAYSAGQGTLLSTNTTTGVMAPIYVGMKTPHGIAFVTF
jgi:hypothetical protein